MKSFTRHVVAALVALSITTAALAGPEKDPVYYFQVGFGMREPFGFAVFDDRTYLYFGVDMVWTRMHWLLPTALLFFLGFLSVYAIAKARKKKKA